MTSSRTKLRLELMREQAFNNSPKEKAPGVEDHQRKFSGSTLPSNIPVVTAQVTNNQSSVVTQPIIIQHPIRFTGKSLVHLPPQIIHAQTGQSLPTVFTVGNKYPQKQTIITVKPVENSQQVLSRSHERRVPPVQSYPTKPSTPLSPAGLSNIDSPYSDVAEDVIIDEILSLEDEQRARQQAQHERDNSSFSSSGGESKGHMLSSPPSRLDVHETVRDRRRKDMHNLIEKRRRYNINDRIKELGTLLPKEMLEDTKMNKGTILKATVDYINELQENQELLTQAIQRQGALEDENRKMQLKIQMLEQQLKLHGVPVPEPLKKQQNIQDTGISKPSGISAQTRQPIKIEPLELDDNWMAMGGSVPNHVTKGIGPMVGSPGGLNPPLPYNYAQHGASYQPQSAFHYLNDYSTTYEPQQDALNIDQYLIDNTRDPLMCGDLTQQQQVSPGVGDELDFGGELQTQMNNISPPVTWDLETMDIEYKAP